MGVLIESNPRVKPAMMAPHPVCEPLPARVQAALQRSQEFLLSEQKH